MLEFSFLGVSFGACLTPSLGVSVTQLGWLPLCLGQGPEPLEQVSSGCNWGAVSSSRSLAARCP